MTVNNQSTNLENDKIHTVNMVSHVHWDPMWYSSFQEYRIRLFQLMQKLLSILENNPDYKFFMFDGQVSALEEYLEIAPENRERIARLVTNGRLHIGPWYVQPEEFLISGESLIRNLKLGIEQSKKLGGFMKVSYLCDPVGHISQLPQILKGFGIPYFVASRGVLDNDQIKHTEFLWEAPDGSTVLVHSLPYGYHNILSRNQADFDREVTFQKEQLIPWNVTGYILYMQGSDHGEPSEKILEFISSYNEMAGREEIRLVSLEQHMKIIESFTADLSSYRGEMRFSYARVILTGILSTRMEIKQSNDRVQTGLEKWLEPFATVRWLLNGAYPEPFINLAWKLQLKNSFHDCIYGAHADHVFPDVMNGYKQALEIISWETHEALYHIARQIRNIPCDEGVIVCFNPTSRERINEVVECELFFSEKDIIRNLAIHDYLENLVPCQLNYIEAALKFSGESGNMMGENLGIPGYKCGISILVDSLPAMGYTTLCLNKKGLPDSCVTDLIVNETSCENTYLRVKIKENGTLDILDKTTGQSYQGLHYFEDSGDKGDQYNYSSTIPKGVVTSKTINAQTELLTKGPVKAVYKVSFDLFLPEGLDNYSQGRCSRYIANKVVSFITVKAGSKVIEFYTILENGSRDHRLTVAFPTGISTQSINSGSQFCVLARDVELPHGTGWAEPPSEFRPHHQFIQIDDPQKGFTFLDRGLTEHKVTRQGDIYVTLLRCTGYLSKDTLAERNYVHAGPAMETPLAQELGRHEYDYAIYFHAGNWETAESYLKSGEFNAPVKTIHLNSAPDASEKAQTLPFNTSFLKVNGAGVVLSALKKGIGSNLIVRIYNITNQPTTARLEFFRPLQKACLVDLNEHFLRDQDFSENVIEFIMSGNQIATFSCEL